MTRTQATSPVRNTRRLRLSALAAASALVLAACGGTNEDSSPAPIVGATSNSLAQQCSPNNVYRGDSAAGPSPRLESLTREKEWVRAYVNEAYLWYDRVPTINPLAAAYSNESNVADSLDNYFSDLTVNPIADDRFSFTFPTRAWNQLSQQGVSLGYGIEFAIQSATVPRVIRIASVEPNTAAARAGLQRGDQITSVDGFDINTQVQAGIDAINAAIFPSNASPHSLGFSRNGTALTTVSLTPADIATTPVPTTTVINTPTGRVGYIVFNDHILTAQSQLITAFNSLAGVNDLVLDLRYNRGGFLFIAAQTAYMIAGPARTGTRVFEQLQFNNKRSAETNSADAITPFYNITTPDLGSRNLPTLNLGRVWVLTSGSSCSASESIINGLRGVDVTVNIIGGTTCGKPFGFTAKDNCGISYFPIEFKGVNAKGFGDFGAGFAPTCAARDDFSRAQGDPSEGMLAQALNHRATGTCSAAFAQGKAGTELAPAMLSMSPLRSSKVLSPELAPKGGVER
jgi:carboxyl-terminal processing protease